MKQHNLAILKTAIEKNGEIQKILQSDDVDLGLLKIRSVEVGKLLEILERQAGQEVER